MGSYYGDIREGEVKNKVAAEWFANYDTTKEVGNIDFSVAVKRDTRQTDLFDSETEFLMWAESKKGTKEDIYESFVQLILTIGKERTFDDNLPPVFLGAFDAEKIAFLPYHEVMEVFTMNDFNWNVTPSDHKSKEFQLLYGMVKNKLELNACKFRYADDGKELARYIKKNFRKGATKGEGTQINKNNFTHVYLKWLKEVKPSIAIEWDEAKKQDLLDRDFYLADLLSDNNKTITDKLLVVLEKDHYEYGRKKNSTGAYDSSSVLFRDGQKAHTHFWLRYKRPPKEEYRNFIKDRIDLLVHQDIRERRGSYYTPSRWVELSQDYIARELGEDWQDDYYVWDCCAGTGNLLAGLTNPRNVYASTLDKQDVQVMKELIAAKSLNLLEGQVFQFDFLNDNFEEKLPKGLQEIIADPEKRRRLVIYINPPYAEATTATTVKGKGKNKSGVATENAIHSKYKDKIGNASKELFAQFLIRIYKEIPGCVLAQFSTLKTLLGPNFEDFRNVFRAKLRSIFLVPSKTFDNVKRPFPIGFFIWRTDEEEAFSEITADVYDKVGKPIGRKELRCPHETKCINEWFVKYKGNKNDNRGTLFYRGNDFQNQRYIYMSQGESVAHDARAFINTDNLIPCCVYLAVRQCIAATWVNNRDQFFWPKDSWLEDKEFQSDCIAYTLFHGQNKISSSMGTNHWIPFTEVEVGAKEAFKSTFMSDFIRGKHKPKPKEHVQGDLFKATPAEKQETAAITFSPEAQAVMVAGRELWRYYHKQPDPINDASFYDIRLHFQGVNAKGEMNKKSKDARYTELVKTLRTRLRTLAGKLAPKVYAHGFLLY